VEQAGNLAAGGWTPWWRMGGCGCSPNPRVATVDAARVRNSRLPGEAGNNRLFLLNYPNVLQAIYIALTNKGYI